MDYYAIYNRFGVWWAIISSKFIDSSKSGKRRKRESRYHPFPVLRISRSTRDRKGIGVVKTLEIYEFLRGCKISEFTSARIVLRYLDPIVTTSPIESAPESKNDVSSPVSDGFICSIV